MKMTVNRSCGHSETVTVFGGNYTQQRAAEARKLCTACYRAQQQATAQAETSDLPTLVGSEKQVAWAITIRAQMLSRLAAHLARFEAPVTDEERAHATAVDAAVARLKRQSKAEFWINHRGDDPARLVDRIVTMQSQGR